MAGKKRKASAAAKSRKAATPKLRAGQRAKPAKTPVKKPAKKPAPKGAPRAAAEPNPWVRYADTLAREAATTLKVMRAYPADQGDFQPHPRSGKARNLFWTFVVEQDFTAQAIRGTLTMPPNFGTPPESVDALVVAFERKIADVLAAVRSATAADYARSVPFFTGPQQMGQVPIGVIAEMMLADQIHHRGQLSVYLRMAGGKVPSIYGPSADEPW